MRFFYFALFGLAACSETVGIVDEPRPNLTNGQAQQEVALVKALFTELQPISIANSAEYCGLIGFDADGRLISTQAAKGDAASCEISETGAIEVVTASYHTHGAFSPDYFNEIPSMADVEGDEADGIDGYIATPGGRLWYVDSSERQMSQLCGIGCLPSDPRFAAGNSGVISQSYTYEGLAAKLFE
jgi:hypothetical protein